MAQLIDILRVVVGTEYFTATVHVNEDGPLMTSEDLEGTTRVYNLMPTIVDHACVGDAGSTFKDCMGDTELAHLLEHMTVELLARTNMVDEVVAGRTWRELAYDRTYSIQFSCVDDVLVAGALTSAAWIMDWAFSGGEGAVPDVDAIVHGLTDMVRGLPEPEPQPEPELVPADRSSYDGYPEDGYDAGGFFGDDFDDGYDDLDDYEEDPYDNEEEESLDRGPRMSRKII